MGDTLEQETYAEQEGRKMFRKRGNSHFGLLAEWYAINVFVVRLTISKKSVHARLLIFATFQSMLIDFQSVYGFSGPSDVVGSRLQ